MTNNVAKEYLRDVKKCLIGARAEKQDFLKGLSEDVTSYIENHPGCSIGEIHSHFGEPGELAEEFASISELKPVKTDMQKREAFRKTIAIVICAFALLVVVLVAIYTSDHYWFTHGHVEDRGVSVGEYVPPEEGNNIRVY